MQVHCSKGTYIRTLCADIGEVLGVGACMESLVRTRVSVFPLEEAHTLAEIEKIRDEGTLEELILPVDRVFEGKTKLTVVPEAFRFLQNGNRLNDGNFTDVPEKLRMVSRYWFMIRWDIFTLYISMREKQRTIKSGKCLVHKYDLLE